MSSIDAGALYHALCQDLSADLPLATMRFPTLAQRRFASDLMRDKFLSKFVPRADDRLDAIALSDFDLSNSLCREWRPPSLDQLNSGEQQLLGTFLKYLNDYFLADLGADCELSWGNIALNARSGPGASFGAKGTSFYQKFYSSPLTSSSPDILDLYKADIAMWPEEQIAESIRAESFGPPRFVGRSRFCFVPKTVKTSRLIAVEPTLNTFYQLGLAAILERRLRRFFGIDLETQPDSNRCMARLGSLIDATFGDGFATIDLTSASDSISLGLAGYILPPEWLDVILFLRCGYAQCGPDGSTIRQLHMVSTMGNGITFPLQTAIFAAATAAAVAQSDDVLTMPKAWSESNIGGLYSVFGDDIVVKSRASERLLWLLRVLGFRPNPEKCFTSGEFRESCGLDFYQGFNVRPFFLRRAETLQDLSVCYNGLVAWAARTLIPIPNALRYLVERIDRLGGAFYVPLSENEDAGIRVPHRLLKSLKRDKSVQSTAYHCHIPRSDFLVCDDSRLSVRGPRGVLIPYNPSGLYLSILRGECRSGRISVRAKSVRYRTKRRISPSWDYMPYTLQSYFDEYDCGLVSFPRRAELVMTGFLPKLRSRFRS